MTGPRFHAIGFVLWQITCLCPLPDGFCDKTYLITGSVLLPVFVESLRDHVDHFVALCGFHAILGVPWQAEITVP